MKEHRIEIFLGRVFLTILSFAITFIVLERISRIFITNRSPIELEFPATNEMRHPEPYVMFGALPHQRGSNALGYRGTMPTVPKRKLRDVSQTSGVNWIDVSQTYTNKHERIFTDEIHTTDPAKHTMARILYQHINKLCAQRIAARENKL